MTNTDAVPFASLRDSDLVVDCIYEGGDAGHVGDDAIARLLPVGNQGGFRYKGSPVNDSVALVALYSTGDQPDWPDSLDIHSGDFTYYGDNRSPGRQLHDTGRRGNHLLERAFAWSHGSAGDRGRVPPFLLFDKSGRGRDVRFRGLLAPGSPRLSGEEELVAVWRSTAGMRFQNYRSHFTLLDVPVVTRRWIDQIVAGDPLGSGCPEPWRTWVGTRTYRPLVAPPTVIIRSKDEQLPKPPDDTLLTLVYRHFAERPIVFEHFAATVFRMSEPRVDRVDITRPWRDGGRDAVGEFMIGPRPDPVAVEFALEAKCYEPGKSSVGVKELSRLISRLRHRQFGVLVTTSYVHSQAYREVRDDAHPVVILAGRDIIDILKSRGIDTSAAVTEYLARAHP